MSAPYPLINGTEMGSNLTYIFTYSNEITGGFFIPFVLLAFFLIVFIGSLMAQYRFTTRTRSETSFAVSSFASFGFVVIMSQVNGLINPVYFMITLGATILGFLWVVFSSEQ
jgi:hypothetical protein